MLAVHINKDGTYLENYYVAITINVYLPDENHSTDREG